MEKGSLFFIWGGFFALILGLFTIPGSANATPTTQVTVSATVLEHITYTKKGNSYLAVTNSNIGYWLLETDGSKILISKF